MSYDLIFYRPLPGATLEAVLDEIEQRVDASDDAPPKSCRLWTASERRQIADLLLRLEPPLEVFEGSDHIELSSTAEPLFQWSLFADELALNWPYFSGAEAAHDLLAKVRPAVDAVLAMGGILYDPQLGRCVDLARDEGEIVAAYVRVDTLRHSDFTSATGSDIPTPPRRKPWWKFW